MSAEPRQAQVAAPANDINLPHHALTDDSLIRRQNHLADELMTEYAGEAHVSLDDFQIRRADSGLADADQGISLRDAWLRMTRLK